jgi:hypothetical protein
MDFHFAVVGDRDCGGERGVRRGEDGTAINSEACVAQDDEESLSRRGYSVSGISVEVVNTPFSLEIQFLRVEH